MFINIEVSSFINSSIIQSSYFEPMIIQESFTYIHSKDNSMAFISKENFIDLYSLVVSYKIINIEMDFGINLSSCRAGLDISFVDIKLNGIDLVLDN